MPYKDNFLHSVFFTAVHEIKMKLKKSESNEIQLFYLFAIYLNAIPEYLTTDFPMLG